MLAAGSLLVAAAGQASAINIGGLDIPIGTAFSAGQVYTNVPLNVGEVLSGYGKIDSYKSDAIADLCVGGACELTYVFGGYTLADTTGGVYSFTGGTIDVYLGTTAGGTKDFRVGQPGDTPATDRAEASNGTLWLTLVGHAVGGYTFQSTGTVNGSIFTGRGEGYLDVNTAGAGVANAAFNTNSLSAGGSGNADFLIQNSFNDVDPPYAGTAYGSMNLTAAAVPEPETYALMLSALGLIGYVVRRRRSV